MKTHLAILLLSLLPIYVGSASAQTKPPEVLLRVDDVGMNHSINQAVEDLCKTGISFSASVMFACPWYQEAVAILKNYPNVAVGIHLTLTSEWRYYRWGPILGKSGAPSLIDSVGYFYQNEAEFLKSGFKLDEVESELEAQITRALMSGLKISYVDPHMGVVLLTPELRALTEKLAKKYGFGISTLGRETFYNEDYKDMWAVPVEEKKHEFLKHLKNLKTNRTNLIILHIARNNPEMGVLEMNNFLSKQKGIPMAGLHRQAELNMLLSPEFQRQVGKNFTLINYADLIKRNSN